MLGSVLNAELTPRGLRLSQTSLGWRGPPTECTWNYFYQVNDLQSAHALLKL